VNNCYYCAFRRDRDTQRTETTPDEMAAAFSSAYQRRLVEGFFLSSGIDSHPDTTMTKLLDTAHIIREKYDYKGYIHLKLMPGVSRSTITESFKVANRISLNIESPTEQDLTRLTPNKTLKNGFFATLKTNKDEMDSIKNQQCKVPSLTTQFVVGAGEEKDKDYIRVTNLMYKRYNMKRVFYSAFRPVPRTPLENKPEETITREHRLYQTDFLMRFYKFNPQDIPLDPFGNLSQTIDPKMMWARKHPEYYPININTAGYYRLLKIPGVGPVSAKKIIEYRNWSRIITLSQLKGCRMQVDKMKEFVCY
jgi:predicted DNA-binding helix-hairpin-helix protein